MLPYSFSCKLGGVVLAVDCQDQQQSAAVRDLWQRLFVLDLCADQAPAVTFSFIQPDQPLAVPDAAEGISTAGALQVLKSTDGYFLRLGSSAICSDISNGRAEGVLNEDFWGQPLEYQREFFLLCFLMLLRPHGRFGLHANAVVHGADGYLISGASGHGKTTLSLSLIQSGWTFVADDALLLHAASTVVEASALRRGLSCTPQTTDRFRDLIFITDEAPTFADGKKLVEFDRQYPERFASGCTPRVLLFPEIREQQESRLLPAGETEAMIWLIEQSPGSLVDKTLVVKQTGMLKSLLGQTRQYRLLLGRDLLQQPQIISDLLLSIGAI